MVVIVIVLMYQAIEVLQQVLLHQVQVKVLVVGEQQGEIKMDGYIIIGLLVLVVVGGYVLFFGGEEWIRNSEIYTVSSLSYLEFGHL